MTSFRSIVPNSTINQINERYEHFLVWLSKDGGVRQWFFSHTDGSERDRHKNFELESLTDIRTIPIEERITVKCETRFMTSNDYDYVKSIFSSNRVCKVLKDGTKIPIAVKKGSPKRPNQIKQFELSLEFSFKEEDILNV